MYEQEYRDYLRSGYLHHRLPWAVNHYRDNAIAYKAQRDKNARELARSWRTRQLLTCRCVSVMLLRWVKYTKELADAKAGQYSA